jgi:hypothetical protein
MQCQRRNTQPLRGSGGKAMFSRNAHYLLGRKRAMKLLWHPMAGYKALGPLIEIAEPGPLSNIYRSH